MISGVLRYGASTALIAVIVAVYFRWAHANEMTVALTFLMVILLAAANWGLRHAVYLSILSSRCAEFLLSAAGSRVYDSATRVTGWRSWRFC